MDTSEAERLLRMGQEQFVQLTTYKSSGDPVRTPVWVARDGSSLVVTTMVDSGKVKRLAADDRVLLRPSSRRGAVDPAAPQAAGRAEVVHDPVVLDRVHDLLRDKYGWEFRTLMALEGALRRRNRNRVALRITPTPG